MLELDHTKEHEKAANTTGSDFVKKIGWLGCVMFTMMFILYLIICFAPKSSLLDGYTPPHDSQYYSNHLDELETELKENVFPKLGCSVSCTLSNDTINIYIPSENFWDVRSAILSHFDENLFEFSKVEQQ